MSTVVERLRAAGCVAADDEAAELVAAAAGDAARLEAMVRRREAGEPLAWITGKASFLGRDVRVDRGVYVPRWQTEVVAARAAARLPERGIAIDLCTGSGAVAAHLAASRPRARVVATDVEERAVECARRNGVDALLGDLDAPLDRSLAGRVDVVVAVPPYVPTAAMHTSLARDVVAFEPRGAIDGGVLGTDVADRVAALAPRWLRAGGALVVELGGDQATPFVRRLAALGFTDAVTLADADGGPCGVEATFRRDT